MEELKILQETDNTLGEIRKAADQQPSTAGVGFYRNEGLLDRHWIPPGRDTESMAVEQLVLPLQCRRRYLILLTLFPSQVTCLTNSAAVLLANHLQGCSKFLPELCNLPEDDPLQTSSCTADPVITEPFQRIAMDIIGPLPRSHSGKRYVLVICDYATRYPEAIPLKTIDAECVAEELVILFSRVGVPTEILTDSHNC